MTSRHGSTQMSVETNRAPLRKVIEETYDEYEIEADRLECGHLVRVPTDFTGRPRPATRRRCKQCGEVAP